MNWKQLNKNEKNIVIITAIFLSVIILYTFIFSPMYQRTDDLQAQINTEKNLANYLNNAKQQLASLPSYPTLTKQKAQQVINAVTKENGIKLNALIMQSNSSIVSINKIGFSKLLNLLNQFKSKNGMVVTKADIKYLATGLVSAHFTLQYP